MKFKIILSAIFTLFGGAMIYFTGDVESVTMAAAAPGYILADEMRSAYVRLLGALPEHFGIDPKKKMPIITQTNLRLEGEITTDNLISFYPRESDSNQSRKTENKVSQTEAFFIAQIALCITKQNDTEFPKGDGNAALHTWPDPQTFDAADEAAALELLYNGTLSFETSSQKRLDEFLCNDLKYVPGKQSEGSQTGTDSFITSQPQYGPENSNRGFYPINPNIIFDGGRDNEFNLRLSNGDTSNISGTDETTKNFAVLLLKGFKISSVTLPQGVDAVHV